MENSFHADLFVMGLQQSLRLEDLLLRATVDAARHKVQIPVLVVK